MKVREYNSKAREAFGKSLVEIGVSIFKAMILLFTVVPITVILKASLDGEANDFSILTLMERMSPTAYLTLIAFITVAFVVGHLFRNAGLKHIHESETDNS